MYDSLYGAGRDPVEVERGLPDDGRGIDKNELPDMRCENVVVIVGVPLLFDINDIADPGRGLGLGLGGPSDSISVPSSEPCTATAFRLYMGEDVSP